MTHTVKVDSIFLLSQLLSKQLWHIMPMVTQTIWVPKLRWHIKLTDLQLAFSNAIHVLWAGLSGHRSMFFRTEEVVCPQTLRSPSTTTLQPEHTVLAIQQHQWTQDSMHKQWQVCNIDKVSNYQTLQKLTGRLKCYRDTVQNDNEHSRRVVFWTGWWVLATINIISVFILFLCPSLMLLVWWHCNSGCLFVSWDKAWPSGSLFCMFVCHGGAPVL